MHRAGTRYLIAGSLGAMLYSEPRLTLDVDLAVALAERELAQMEGRFPKPEYYCPPLEVLQAENRRECRAHFNVIHVPTGLKADFYPQQRDAFFDWAWRERREAPQAGGPVFYAPPEYVIVWKTAYFREGGGEKHVRDIRRMLEISGDGIREGVLVEELGRRGLLETYRSLVS